MGHSAAAALTVGFGDDPEIRFWPWRWNNCRTIIVLSIRALGPIYAVLAPDVRAHIGNSLPFD
jgi:hypothetical protein